ncbi:MAG TPA: carboxyl transferase domain-containing protein [Syntrophales bacterium]|nr:carboxyl transferase domain-containing protein [Syntrophales bacterium]
MDRKKALSELYMRRERVERMGGEEEIKAQHERGRLTARERVDKLLDKGSFWEVGMQNHSDVPGMEEASPADGKVCGIGTIDGRRVAVDADDRTTLGGSTGRIGIQKFARLHRMATEKGYPIIGLGDCSGGIRLPDRMGSAGLAEGTCRWRGPADYWFQLPRQTPRIEAIMGECFGMPSWHAARADFVAMVKGSAMGAAGPRIVEKAIGQRITPQQLCGWELHAHVTGQVDAFAENDEECLAIIREFLSYMPSHNGEEPPFLPTQDSPDRRLKDAEKIVPLQLTRSYDMHRLIKVIVDDGNYFPLKAQFGKALITCLARIAGKVVGIIANNPMHNAGAPDVPSIDKAISFICLCDSFNIPLIFLADIPGMYPGMESERQKIPTKIVVMIEAQELATVPKIHILVRKAYGIGWRCMCGGQQDIIAAWPTASISFVDPEIGIEVVHGRRLAEDQNSEAERKRLLEEWSVESSPWGGAGITPLEIIDPADTRKFIATSLDILRGNRSGGIGEHKLANWPTGF